MEVFEFLEVEMKEKNGSESLLSFEHVAPEEPGANPDP